MKYNFFKLLVFLVILCHLPFVRQVSASTCTAGCVGGCNDTCCSKVCLPSQEARCRDGSCGELSCSCCCWGIEDNSVDCKLVSCGIAKSSQVLSDNSSVRSDNSLTSLRSENIITQSAGENRMKSLSLPELTNMAAQANLPLDSGRCSYSSPFEEWMLIHFALDDENRFTRLEIVGEYTTRYRRTTLSCLPLYFADVGVDAGGYGTWFFFNKPCFRNNLGAVTVTVEGIENLSLEAKYDSDVLLLIRIRLDENGVVENTTMFHSEMDEEKEGIGAVLVDSPEDLADEFLRHLSDNLKIEYPGHDRYPLVVILEVKIRNGRILALGQSQYSPLYNNPGGLSDF